MGIPNYFSISPRLINSSALSDDPFVIQNLARKSPLYIAMYAVILRTMALNCLMKRKLQKLHCHETWRDGRVTGGCGKNIKTTCMQESSSVLVLFDKSI